GLALARHPGGAEVRLPGGAEVRESLERLRERGEHRLDEMPAGAWIVEPLCAERALGEREALLLGERPRALVRHLRAGGGDPRRPLGRGGEEVVEPHATRAALGQFVVELGRCHVRLRIRSLPWPAGWRARWVLCPVRRAASAAST